MRKITEESVCAFKIGHTFSKSNTTVHTTNRGELMYLFGNMIAHKEGNELFISTCGWRSNTTKERLNGILSAYELPTIYQKKGIWYFTDGKIFEGTRIFKNINKFI